MLCHLWPLGRALVLNSDNRHSAQTEAVNERGVCEGLEVLADRQAGRQTDRQAERRSQKHGKKNLLTVFDPCGRVQPETDLFELGRLEGSRLTLRGRRERNKEEK